MTIRPAGDGDRAAIARLHASFLDDRVYGNRLEKWRAQEILPQDLVLVANVRIEWPDLRRFP